MHDLAAAAMPEHHRRAGGLQPAVAPLHQRDQYRQQLRSLVCQPVGHPGALAWLPVRLARQQAVVDQFPEPGRCHRLADADALGEVVEPGRPVERLAQDEQRGPAADDIQGARHRARGRLPPVARVQRPGHDLDECAADAAEVSDCWIARPTLADLCKLKLADVGSGYELAKSAVWCRRCPRAAGAAAFHPAWSGPGHRVRRGGHGQPGPVHRQRRAAADRGGPARAEPGHAVLGAERLRDHLRGAACPGRPAGRPAQPQERLPARRGDLHGRVGGLRRGRQRADADRVPAGAGRGRGAADADLARPGPGELSSRAARRRRACLDRGRRHGRRARPGDRRPARRCELAMGVLRQRADRPRRAGHRLAQAAGRARSSRAATRRAVGGARHGRRRRPDPRTGPRRRLGLGLGRDGRRAGRVRDRARALRAPLPAASQPADRA